jgi:hypothetical protein
VIYTFGYVGGPPGSTAANPVTWNTTSNNTPWHYFIFNKGFFDGSEIARPWNALLKSSYWPIPVAGVFREGDIAGGAFMFGAGTSIRVSVAEWLALEAAGAA